MKHPHLIAHQELLEEGALDVPPKWRKSLSAGRKAKPSTKQRSLSSSLVDDEDAAASDSHSAEDEAAHEDPADDGA